MIEDLKELLIENKCLLADGFDEALIGITDNGNNVAVYDSRKCIEILMERDDMSTDDACEFFLYNVIGSYVGDKTPVFVNLSFVLF
jgi:hypothetical protein